MGHIDELDASLHKRMQALAESVDIALASEQVQRWMRFCASMPRYTWRNLWLALWQDRDATQIAPRRYWESLGRALTEDARPIYILKPASGLKHECRKGDQPADIDHADASDDRDQPKKIDRSSRLLFIEVPVYDVRHTDGLPLPDIEWRSLEKRESLAAALDAYAAERGIRVEVRALAGTRQGVAETDHIDISPDAGTKTRVHEIAHIALGHCDSKAWMTPAVKEWQAEMVAWTVCQHFDLPGLNCPNYLAGWGATARKLKAHFAICAQTSRNIILGLERLMGCMTVEPSEVPAETVRAIET